MHETTRTAYQPDTLNATERALPDLVPHDLAEIFPMHRSDELARLVANIAETHGLIDPITLYEGKILDGRNRYLACKQAGVEPTFIEYEGTDPLGLVVARNLCRRDLTKEQRALAGARIANLKNGTNQHAKKVGSSSELPTEALSVDQAAALVNVPVSAIKRAKRVQEHGSAALVAAVESGAVSLSTAEQIARMRKPQQAKALALSKREQRALASDLRGVPAGAAVNLDLEPPPELDAKERKIEAYRDLTNGLERTLQSELKKWPREHYETFARILTAVANDVLEVANGD